MKTAERKSTKVVSARIYGPWSSDRTRERRVQFVEILRLKSGTYQVAGFSYWETEDGRHGPDEDVWDSLDYAEVVEWANRLDANLDPEDD